MGWMRDHYGKEYAANSRETIRRQTIHQFEQARLIDRNPDNPARPTNSGDTVYQLTNEVTKVLMRYGKPNFSKKCREFVSIFGELSESYRRTREILKIPIQLPDGSMIKLSPGDHNELQKQILEEFAPRFCNGAKLLYLGDTADKHLFVQDDVFQELRIPSMNHEKLPDVVLFDSVRNWLFLIEAVTSHGPISPKRHAELEQSMNTCPAGRVYVTAFPDFATFKKYAVDIAWESEVWIAEIPDHMIHFNGSRFLGPYT
jgi:adenine-specific DNA-methyltransferase